MKKALTVLTLVLLLSVFGFTQNLATVITALGARESTLTIFKQYAVTDDLTIHVNTTLKFLQGGSVTITAAKTLTINGRIEAGLYQIFEGVGVVNFGASSVKEVYPQWWGAVGDDVADDKVAIQSAIDAASALGGGKVFFPKGIYLISNLLIMRSNVTLEGTGESSVINVDGDFQGLYYLGTDVDRIENTIVRNLKLIGTGSDADTANTLIAMSAYVERAWIDNCWLVDAGYDGWYALRETKHVFITNCYIMNAGDDGLNPGGSDEGTGTSDILLQGNYIEDAGSDGIHLSVDSMRVSAIGNIIVTCGNGVGIFNSGYHLIEDNIIRNCGVGIKTLSGTTPYLKISDNLIDTTTAGSGIIVSHSPGHCEISGNTILSIETTFYGIHVTGFDYGSIIGNIIKDAKDGIRMSTGDNNIISDNIIEEMVEYGIVASGGAGNVNNLISNNSIRTINNNDGIYVNSEQGLITNNMIRDTGGNSIEDALGNNRIINNDVDNTIVAPATTALIHTDASRNFGIGRSTFGTAFAGGLGMKSGTAPTTSPADMAHFWVEDIAGAGGKAGLHTRPEVVPAGAGLHIIPGVLIKADTGDPAYSHEGMICINTFDNTVKIYAEGAWRAMVTPW